MQRMRIQSSEPTYKFRQESWKTKRDGGKGGGGQGGKYKERKYIGKEGKRMERLEGGGERVIWSENQNGWVEEKLSGWVGLGPPSLNLFFSSPRTAAHLNSSGIHKTCLWSPPATPAVLSVTDEIKRVRSSVDYCPCHNLWRNLPLL